ncbi:MAG: pilin [Minisyncoccia bacterium]
MKKIIVILSLILIPIFFTFGQQNQDYLNPPNGQQNQDYLNPLKPEAWGYFYKQIAPSAIPKCAEGKDTALGKITACVEKVTNALKYFSAIIFVLMIVVVAGFFIFSPMKKELIEKGKKALLYTFLGFIIIFVADEILKLIEELTK